MRLNLKKIFGFVIVFGSLWIIYSYTSSQGVPKPRRIVHDAEEMEKRIDQLQKDMNIQIQESSMLLDLVKQRLYKTESLSQAKLETGPKEEPQEEQAEGYQIPQAPSGENLRPILPILVISCDRVTVRRCLDNLTKFRPNKETFPIIVSQDCGHNQTYKVIKSFSDADPSITVIRQPDLSEIKLNRSQITYKGYYKIARHFKFALNYMFRQLNYDAVIIVEDDLDISPDFFEYFLGTYPLLLKDPSLWCISAWNDNGKKNLIDLANPHRLYRTDFFPGLGWLLRREMWDQIEPKWPPAFFDDWLRDPENTQNRACIRPEISRTYSFGKIGVSKGLFFENHLRHMQLNMEFVEFTKHNLTYLLKHNYDPAFKQAAYSAPIYPASDVISGPPGRGQSVRVLYSDAKSFRKAAKTLGLMDDVRSGIPRTAYMGIVSCVIKGRRVYLTPDYDWTKYDPKWS